MARRRDRFAVCPISQNEILNSRSVGRRPRRSDHRICSPRSSVPASKRSLQLDVHAGVSGFIG